VCTYLHAPKRSGHNINILNGLTQPSLAQNGVTKGRINNILMQIRKYVCSTFLPDFLTIKKITCRCLQHPYLYAEDIEPRDLSPAETHGKLIDASGKLRFLKSLLPKLKQQGHRVLLFSQVSFLTYIETTAFKLWNSYFY